MSGKILITEKIEEVNSVIQEDKQAGKKSYFIEGPFMQAAIRNRNGRIYPLEVLQKEVARYIKEMIEPGRAVGELNHPDSPNIDYDRASHKIISLKQEGNNFIGKAKVMTSMPKGKIVQSLMDEGVKFGVSSRGMGSLKRVSNDLQEVCEDFWLATAADIVSDPSAPDAFVNGIMEGRAWVWDNGLWKEQKLEEAKDQINKAASKNLKVTALSIFENLLNELGKK